MKLRGTRGDVPASHLGCSLQFGADVKVRVVSVSHLEQTHCQGRRGLQGAGVASRRRCASCSRLVINLRLHGDL